MPMPNEYVQGLATLGGAIWNAFAGPPVKAESLSPAKLFAAANYSDLHQLQWQYWHQHLSLWTGQGLRSALADQAPASPPELGDRRFISPEWNEIRHFDRLKQAYLLDARFFLSVVETVEVDPKTKRKLRFFAQQFVDALSPSNFLLTNPEAIKLAMESDGQTLLAGIQNLLADANKGRITITDEAAFEVGRNVAASEGAVVFENELFQLLQYAPRSASVAARPLLIVPPCINKFYILDLQPDNSFVRFACEHGHTTFLVSWRSASESMRNVTWDDYVRDGVMKAISVVLEVSGAKKLNALGWCVGGTILSCALAVMRAGGETSVASLTLLTTMLDFDDPGDLGVFIDEQGVRERERSFQSGGIYSGQELAFVFQTLRANDLIWPNVVNGYLKGKSPPAFDLLYWNADCTNLPGPMYAWYLRNMYLENNLRTPGRLSICGVPIDLGRIDVPSYVLATREDHIVPWKSAYCSTRLLGGKTQFVLGASGHIAGVINPASKNKRSFWADGSLDGDGEAWLASAKPSSGSWWTHWMQWMTPHCGRRVTASDSLGSERHRPIEAAPGRYVKERAQ